MDNMSEMEFKKIEEKLEGLLVKAVQSGKKETSDLADSILKKQEIHIESSVNKYVNGKIDKLKSHLEMQDHMLTDIKDEQGKVREELAKVQARTDPLVESRKTVLNVGRFLIWLGAVVGASTTIILIILKLAQQ